MYELKDCDFAPIPNIVTLNVGADLPDVSLITACFTLVFNTKGQILLVTQDKKRWHLPAGRPEGGESPAETASKGVWEMSSVSTDTLTLIANRHVQIDADCPNDYYEPYPEQYHCFFVSQVLDAQVPEPVEGQTHLAKFFDPEDALKALFDEQKKLLVETMIKYFG